MTRDSISRYRNGVPWSQAGVDIWQDRPEGSNAGNGSVMRCAPSALAFRDVEEDLVHVSRVSSTITHADPRWSWSCALLNLTLATLLRDVQDPLDRALGTAGDLPGEIEDAISPVDGVLTGYRDPEVVENTLETTDYVVDAVPERWRAEVDAVAHLERLADDLLEIRAAEPGREFAALEDGSLRFPGVTR